MNKSSSLSGEAKWKEVAFIKTSYVLPKVLSFFTKLKLDDNSSPQQSCSEQTDGHEPPDIQQLTYVSNHLANAECKLNCMFMLGALAFLKYWQQKN
jgi:hypothetical protein